MIEIPVTHPDLPGLFDPHIPNNPALWAVLLGKHQGRALVDNAQHPTQCVLRTEAVLTYASLGVTQTFLAEALEYFSQANPIWLVRRQGDVPSPVPYRILPRLEFYEYDSILPTLSNLRAALPDELKLRPIDLSLLNRCEWRDDMAFYCGSLENFIKNGLGLCLMRADEIIVEAYASALGNPYAEIGAITHEAYRGRGYAPVTVAYLIEALEQRGYHAYWSCDLDNPASARVARKLGFRIERSYEICEYQPPGDKSAPG
jgi:GNAT superfamily N-acetyltransferase